MGQQVEEYQFSHKEVVEALIKKQDLREGIWMLQIKFGIGAANVQNPDAEEQVVPAAIVPIVAIGLQKQEKINALALDAAVVNPKTKKK